jgi:hypothetical protein
MKKQFILTRYSNEYTYLKGVIKYENNFVSDTLELGCLSALKNGIYTLIVAGNKSNNLKSVYIVNAQSEIISCFTGLNITKYKNSWIRNFNNYISLGVSSKHPLLSNAESYLNHFTKTVQSLLNQNHIVELIIETKLETEIKLFDMINEEWSENNHL